jgi:rod shape-determining protein MreD
MDRRWPFTVFVALLIALHLFLRVGLGLGFWAPDLLTIALLLAARRLPAGWAAGLGLAFGLIRDAVNLTTFGSDMVVMTVLGYLGSRTRDYFVGDSTFFLAIYLFLGKWLHDALYFVVSRAIGVEDAVSVLLIEAPLAAAYSAFAGLVAFSAYRAFARER